MAKATEPKIIAFFAAEPVEIIGCEQDCDCSHCGRPLKQPYISTAARQFSPGNFVTTWNPDIGRNAVGVTRAVEDVQEANPRILVKWLHDLSEEWVRSEYLYLST